LLAVGTPATSEYVKGQRSLFSNCPFVVRTLTSAEPLVKLRYKAIQNVFEVGVTGCQENSIRQMSDSAKQVVPFFGDVIVIFRGAIVNTGVFALMFVSVSRYMTITNW